MASEFDTLISKSALPVLQDVLGEDARADVGSGVYHETGRADQTFYYILGKARDRQFDDSERGLVKEKTLDIELTSDLLGKPRLNGTVTLGDGVLWSIKEVHGTGVGITKLVLTKGQIMQRSRPGYRTTQ